MLVLKEVQLLALFNDLFHDRPSSAHELLKIEGLVFSLFPSFFDLCLLEGLVALASLFHGGHEIVWRLI
jgi:hypothetical protein